MGQKRGALRVSAGDYEVLITGLLCGEIPPGEHRDECARRTTRKLIALYARFGLTPPPGLAAFAERVGVAPDETDFVPEGC